jgi:hypothetical protein
MNSGPEVPPVSERQLDEFLHPVQVKILRRMSFEDRVRVSQELTRDTWNYALSAFRARYPELTEQQVLKKFVAFNYGQELAEQVYPHL